MPVVGPIWDCQYVDEAAAARLAAALGIAPLVARLLCQRGLDDPETAARFLNPSLDHLHDPMLLADMPPAVARVRRAQSEAPRLLLSRQVPCRGRGRAEIGSGAVPQERP